MRKRRDRHRGDAAGRANRPGRLVRAKLRGLAFLVRNVQEKHPDLLLTVWAPETPGVDPKSRLLYTSPLRQDSGRQEAWIISLTEDQLWKAGITPPSSVPREAEPTPSVLDRLKENTVRQVQLSDGSIDIVRQRMEAHRTRYAGFAEKLKPALLASLSRLPPAPPNPDRFVAAGVSPFSKSADAIVKGIQEITNSDKLEVRAPARGYISLTEAEVDELQSQAALFRRERMPMPGSSLSGQLGSAALQTAIIRRRIRSELPSHLFRPYPTRALTALAIAGAIVLTSSVMVFVPALRSGSIILSCVCGCLYASLFFIGHEAGHGAILRSKAGQDLIMAMAFAPFLLSPTLWRVWHNKVHHAHTNNEASDPDNVGTLSTFNRFRSVRFVVDLTPGGRKLLGVVYLPIWFMAHAQMVLWIQSRRCFGFELLDRRRAVAESFSMALFWILLGLQLGPRLTLLVILFPVMVANTIIMSYISTNHLLRPLVNEPDVLESSMSVTTYRWLDLIHFNFSHHVEHHFFPSMSSKYAPCVREKLRQYAKDRYLAPPHWTAFRMVFLTPRIHDEDGALIDPKTNLRVPFDEITNALRCRDK